MDIFSRFKKAAVQVYQVATTAATAVASELATSYTTQRKPEEEFKTRFQTIIKTIDDYSTLDIAESFDVERMLHETRIREHIQVFLKYLVDEDMKWIASHMKSKENEENIDHPCFEIFLQEHYMEELTRRTAKDIPRGVLPLVLEIVVDILNRVNYPLLPHQAVHKSVHQLITHASNSSIKYSNLAKSKTAQTKTDITNYVKRIDRQLAVLIKILWRKIAESPSLLNFFKFVDPSKKDKSKAQLEIVTALIPLMGKAKIGQEAKEAMLIAISLRHEYVDWYILHETTLLQNIVTELSKKFQNGIAALNTYSPNVIQSFVSNTINSLSNPSASPQSSANPMNSVGRPVAIESFIKVLRFCAAIVSISYRTADKNSVRSIYSELCAMYLDEFIRKCVRPALLENSEQQVLATQAMVKILLIEITSCAPSSYDEIMKHNHLSILTTEFISRDGELLQTFLLRASSVARVVTVSTLHLINTLFSTMSVKDCFKLILPPLKGISGGPIQADQLERLDNLIHGNIEGIDGKDDYGSSSMEKIVSQISLESKHRVSLLATYSGIIEITSEVEMGIIMKMMLHKLNAFLSLKFDEQVAVTGLVERGCVLISTIILFHDSFGKIGLQTLLNIYEVMIGLYKQIRNHIQSSKIHDSEKKIAVIKSILADSSKCDSRMKRYIEQEPAQVLRMLETYIIVSELLREVHGCLVAIKNLRQADYITLCKINSSTSSATTQQPNDITMEVNKVNKENYDAEDEDDDDEEARHEFQDIRVALNEFNVYHEPAFEEQFLAEFEELQSDLNAICDQ